MAYSKFDRDREEVAASLLGNGLASGHARKIDVGRLNEALLALDGAKELLSEASSIQSDLNGHFSE